MNYNEAPEEYPDDRRAASAPELNAMLVGSGTNPRWLLWEIWHGLNQGMKGHDFIGWINDKWNIWTKLHGKNRYFLSEQDHEDFDKWLILYTREEIIRTCSKSDNF
jgi:hypothetical protein